MSILRKGSLLPGALFLMLILAFVDGSTGKEAKAHETSRDRSGLVCGGLTAESQGVPHASRRGPMAGASERLVALGEKRRLALSSYIVAESCLALRVRGKAAFRMQDVRDTTAGTLPSSKVSPRWGGRVLGDSVHGRKLGALSQRHGEARDTGWKRSKL